MAMAKGSLIGKAETFPKAVDMVGEEVITLEEMINFCITHPLEGTELASDDPAMRSLINFHNLLIPLPYEEAALPIINESCSKCHTGDSPTTNLNLADKDTALKNAEKIRELVESGRMPRGGDLDDMSYMTLITWATGEIDNM